MGLFRLALLRLLLSFLLLGGNPITIVAFRLFRIRRKTLRSPVKILFALTLRIGRTIIQEITLFSRWSKTVFTSIGNLIFQVLDLLVLCLDDFILYLDDFIQVVYPGVKLLHLR